MIILAVLMLVVGSSATGSVSRVTIRPASAAAVSGIEPQGVAPARRPVPRNDLNDERMLAWLLLLMKEGRGAR